MIFSRSTTTMMVGVATLFFLAITSTVVSAQDSCLANETLNAEFVSFIDGAESIPLEGSCCQADVCGLACPAEVSDPAVGFAIAVAVAIAISFLIGLATYFIVDGEAENYFVCGKSLPLWIVAMTLGAQSVDSNALLGNVDLSYKYHFWDGACIPIGLGLSLLLNGFFLASHINKEVGVLTLPDVLSRRYGKVHEVIISCASIVSFMMLLAGNLVGMGVICAYVWGISTASGVWISSAIVWVYTVSGGLFSVAYTDVAQGVMGWSGCIVCAFWLIKNASPSAPPPSVGFPLYVYPDEATCTQFQGVPCENVPDACCYNTELWCSDVDDVGTCSPIDNGAYPVGDQRVFNDQMTDRLSLSPFPNAIFWNWATIFILAFGNLAALDFQARCMAAKTPQTAKYGCFIGGLFTFFIGIPFSYVGSITRVYYGPDSIHAEFAADTCLEILGLPTCGQWVPDPLAFLHLLTHETKAWIGAWCLVGIVAASMSTADGAILAMGTVWSHNIMRQADSYYPDLVSPKNLLLAARLSTIPFTLAATLIAWKVNKTGYLLIVAFDVMLASVVAPLFACFHVKNPSPRAAFCSTISGIVTRVVLEFALPKDGFLILPFKEDEFLDYGSAASSLFPTFFDVVDADKWDPATEPCDSPRLEDYTGVDSLVAFFISIIVFGCIQWYENSHGGEPLFTFPGLEPYEKDLTDHDAEDAKVDDINKTKQVHEQNSSEEEVQAEAEEVEADSEAEA